MATGMPTSRVVRRLDDNPSTSILQTELPLRGLSFLIFKEGKEEKLGDLRGPSRRTPEVFEETQDCSVLLAMGARGQNAFSYLLGEGLSQHSSRGEGEMARTVSGPEFMNRSV